MSDFATEPRSPQPKGPKCPKCEVQPCMIAMAVVSMGMGALTAIFICQDCETILGVSPLPSVKMQEVPGENPLIVRPS